MSSLDYPDPRPAPTPADTLQQRARADSPGAQWFVFHDVLLAVAAYGVTTGTFDTADLVLYFFEKPWKWESLRDEWLASDPRA